MAGIPNTTTAGQVLTSVGNGSGDAYWSSSGGGSGTNATELQGHPISSTAPSSQGQLLQWNGSAWIPYTMTGDIAYSATGNDYYLKSIGGVPIATGVSPNNGNFLVYNTTGTTDWTYEATPTATGQIMYWNGTYWAVTTAPTTTGQVLEWNGSAWIAGTTGGTGVTNVVWDNSAISAGVSTGTSTSPVAVTGFSGVSVTGFSSYLVTYTASISSTNAATSASIAVALNGTIWFGGSAASGAINYKTMRGNAGDVSSLSITVPLTGLTSTTSYTVSPYAVVGAGTGTMNYGQITILGVA